MENNNRIKRFIAFAAAALIFSAAALPVTAATSRPSTKTFQQDLARYHKLVNQKKLSLDDKLSLLLNMEKKYKHSKVNLAPVHNEIERLKKAYTQNISSDAPPAANLTNTDKPSAPGTPVVSTAVPAIENISIMDSDGNSQVIVTARGVRHSNYFLLRGPNKEDIPAVALDIYGVTLIDTMATVKSAKSAFSEASVHLLRETPEPVVRVIAQMRSSRQYRVQREGSDRWIIVIDKEAPAVVISTAPRVEPATDELVPEVLAVPASELPVEMRPIETPAVITPPVAEGGGNNNVPQTASTRTPLEQTLPWASLVTLIIIIAISI